MCDFEPYVTLHQSKDTEIIFCKCCKSFSMIHRSTCASFNAAELRHFKEILESLRAPAFHYKVQDEAKAVVMKPKVNVGFCLSEPEVVGLIDGINESLTLFEAFEIIYQ